MCGVRHLMLGNRHVKPLLKDLNSIHVFLKVEAAVKTLSRDEGVVVGIVMVEFGGSLPGGVKYGEKIHFATSQVGVWNFHWRYLPI